MTLVESAHARRYTVLIGGVRPRRRWLAAVVVAISLCAACTQPSPASEPTAASAAVPRASTSPVESASSAPPSNTTAANVAVVTGPDGLVLGGQCPDPGPTAQQELDRQQSARIPLKVGLTLTSIWVGRPGDGDRECLNQVKEIDASSVVITQTCPVGDDRRIATHTRRLCRADLRDAYMFHSMTASTLPVVIRGATMFSLSSRSFRELKSNGQSRHRYLEIAGNWQGGRQILRHDDDGALGDVDARTRSLLINDRPADVPVLEVSGVVGQTKTWARVLDDENFPLVIKYEVPRDGFSVEYLKVSFPTEGDLENTLATEKHVDVYGIYFDFASDVLRPESEPVLREIADALAKHADWRLRIQGHTDNIGGDAVNLDLSRRRSDAVKKALTDRYAIDTRRLTTEGFGASQPKEPNDTIAGRAKNRRVELVRQ